jgi:hypothetical protein
LLLQRESWSAATDWAVLRLLVCGISGFFEGEKAGAPLMMQVAEMMGQVEKPAVLVDGRAPYAIVDVNQEWLKACSYGSREEVVGQTLSIIQVTAAATLCCRLYYAMLCYAATMLCCAVARCRNARRQNDSRTSANASDSTV